MDIHQIPLNRHEDSFLTLHETSTEKRFDMPYRKTFAFAEDTIDDEHASYPNRVVETGMIDIGVEGWLLPQDAQKLYEMAYFSNGDILEIGTYRGLSAAIMSHASAASQQQNVIISVDFDENHQVIARNNLKGLVGTDRVHLFCDDGTTAVKNLASAKRHFKFAFIDHSHEYEHVYGTCASLHRVIELGGFALFHDFNDPRNAAINQKDYGVYQGVLDGLDPRRFEFWGIYGCTGLFRRIGPF